MPTYEQVWKLFRRLSNENDVTAEHLVARPLWPRGHELRIVDVGCGDGLLAQRVVLMSRSAVAEVRLLDPDPAFLEQANRHVTETGVVQRVVPCLGSAEDTFGGQCATADVVLAVHVVYLLVDNALEQIIAQLPTSVPMYVVMDSPDSVFARLWQRTAPKYYARSRAAHELFERRQGHGLDVTRTTISARLDNPLDHPQEAVTDGVLSLLAYTDIRKLSDDDRRWVRRQIERSVIGDHVHCESTCYEIARRSR